MQVILTILKIFNSILDNANLYINILVIKNLQQI